MVMIYADVGIRDASTKTINSDNSMTSHAKRFGNVGFTLTKMEVHVRIAF